MLRNSLGEGGHTVAVSDASPLIALKHAGILEKLANLFHEVLIPPAVMREISVKEEEYFHSLGFLSVNEPHDKAMILALKAIVDEGEAEAIALASERRSLLIIDDLKGRKVAKKLGLRIIGTLGILKTMKLRGLIREIRPAIEKLMKEGFYISEDLVNEVLSEVGEA